MRGLWGLLERDDVNPNATDTKRGCSPLSWAAQNGCEGVVKMLAERGDVNPNTADLECGLTPLWLAAANGHAGVVKMLLQRKDVDPNTADTERGLTPLILAAVNGDEEVAKILLERDDVNPNTTDIQNGRTPLSWAASQGYDGVVKMLLGRKDVYTTTPDHGNQDALSLALSYGHHEVVGILGDNAHSHIAARDVQASLPPSARHVQCSQASRADGRALRDGSPFRPGQVVLACRVLASVFRKDGSLRG